MDKSQSGVTSILDGVQLLIEQWLGIASVPEFKSSPLKNKKALIALSEHGGRLNGAPANTDEAANLAVSVLNRIKENHEAMGNQNRGPKETPNWRICRMDGIAMHSASAEKRLEKFLVNNHEAWFNQVPTCSGMAYKNEGKRSIDLGFPFTPSKADGYELIELKFGYEKQNYGSNNPLYAAFEHFQYAALYVYCRWLFEQNPARYPDPRLLIARRIKWIVWAPNGFYRYRRRGHQNAYKYNLAWLERVLTFALTSAAGWRNDNPPKMDFQFCTMTPELERKTIADLALLGIRLDENLIQRIPLFS